MREISEKIIEEGPVWEDEGSKLRWRVLSSALWTLRVWSGAVLCTTDV